jgi:hypothetical protein
MRSIWATGPARPRVTGLRRRPLGTQTTLTVGDSTALADRSVVPDVAAVAPVVTRPAARLTPIDALRT